MNQKKFSNDMDAMIEAASEAAGTDRKSLDRIIGNDPQAAKLLSRLTPDDIRKLQQVISDPAKTKALLSSPQAQNLINSLRNSGKG